MAAPRPAERRKADSLAKLAEPGADAWVATGGEGGAHLVPLSIGWDGERIVLVTETASVTARNLVASGTARLGLGPTRDVVVVDAVVEEAAPIGDAPASLAEAFARQSGWDARQSGGDLTLFALRLVRVQAWREANELTGRTVLREGQWVV